MIGAAIAVFLTLTLLVLAHQAIGTTEHLNARNLAATAADALQERLESDATSAWGIWVPVTDVLGNANADGHEIDFLSQDTSHRIYAWAYRFDAPSATVTRYAYAPGVTPVAGSTYVSLGAFSAQEFAVSALRDPASPFFDGLFAKASVTPYTYPLSGIANAHGGNGLVRVQIGGVGVDIDETFASATAPAGFTIVATYTPSPAPAVTPIPTPLPLVQL